MPKRILTEEQRLRNLVVAKKWKEKNKDKVIAYRKKYYLLNKEKIKEERKKHYLLNKDVIYARQKKHRKSWIAKMTKEEKTKYFRKYAKRYQQRKKIKTINNFILFLAQTCEIITKIIPNYQTNNFEKKIINLELV